MSGLVAGGGCITDYLGAGTIEPAAADPPDDLGPVTYPTIDASTPQLVLDAMPVDGITVFGMSPGRGPVGTIVEVLGGDFRDGDVVVAARADAAETALVTVSLQPTRILARVPALPSGDYRVRVRRGAGDAPADGWPFALVPGQVHYMAPDGSDSADGSAAAPWRNFDAAAARMGPGDVTYVRGGTYADDRPIGISASGVPGAPLTFVAYPGDTPLVYLKNAYPKTPYDTLQVLGAYVTVDRIRFTNQNTAGGQVLWIGTDAHDVVVSSCEIFGAYGTGLMISGRGSVALHNSVHDNGHGTHQQYDHGIYLAGGGNTVAFNTVRDNWSMGIQVYKPDGKVVTGNLIEGNYVYHNGYGLYGQLPSKDSAGIVVGLGQHANMIRNNKVCANAKVGIALIDFAKGNQLIGNVTCFNRAGGLHLAYPGSGTVVYNHISFNDQPFAFATVSPVASVSSDDNTFFSTNGMPGFRFDGAAVGFDLLRTASKGEAHSKIADPQFANLPAAGFDPAQAGSYSFATPLNAELASPP